MKQANVYIYSFISTQDEVCYCVCKNVKTVNCLPKSLYNYFNNNLYLYTYTYTFK